MPRLLFTLTMPGVASWDGKWSGADRRYAATRTVSKTTVAKLDTTTHSHAWGDGWRASISVRAMKKGERLGKTAGFCGYEWMIDNILDHGTTYDAAHDPPEAKTDQLGQAKKTRANRPRGGMDANNLLDAQGG